MVIWIVLKIQITTFKNEAITGIQPSRLAVRKVSQENELLLRNVPSSEERWLYLQIKIKLYLLWIQFLEALVVLICRITKSSPSWQRRQIPYTPWASSWHGVLLLEETESVLSTSLRSIWGRTVLVPWIVLFLNFNCSDLYLLVLFGSGEQHSNGCKFSAFLKNISSLYLLKV